MVFPSVKQVNQTYLFFFWIDDYNSILLSIVKMFTL